MQIEEIYQADDQIIDGLGVYEIMPEEQNDDSEDEDPAKMYSTGERDLMSPLQQWRNPPKKSIWVPKMTLGP